MHIRIEHLLCSRHCARHWRIKKKKCSSYLLLHNKQLQNLYVKIIVILFALKSAIEQDLEGIASLCSMGHQLEQHY